MESRLPKIRIESDQTTRDITAPSRNWTGPSCFFEALEADASFSVDVVLLTHPRDENDVPRLFPWSTNLNSIERRELVRNLKPIVGEIFQSERLSTAHVFLPFFADEALDPRKRKRCRQILESEALQTAAQLGAKTVCLGGLTGALSVYGKRLEEPAKGYGLNITTGHSATAVSVHRTYREAARFALLDVSASRLTILGIGGIGMAVARLVAADRERPREVVLIDRPNRDDRLYAVAQELSDAGVNVSVELFGGDGQLNVDSKFYESEIGISAVSTPYIVDPWLVKPGAVLVDDSQPYCWDRLAAWLRYTESGDIYPCEAGLVDVHSTGHRCYFPFDFADQGPMGSGTAWSCMSEGILQHLDPTLPRTLGDPSLDTLFAYAHAFDRHHFGVPPLQCGGRCLNGITSNSFATSEYVS